jgi:serine/threonine protein kinase
MLGENQRWHEALARRFEREARETDALGSIHTIEVYDFGVTEEGDFYYVMELLEGISVERNTVCGKVRRSTLVSVIVTSAGSS